MEPTIYKPSIYKGNGIYKNGASGGGGGGGGGGDDTMSNIGGRDYRTITINGITWLAENLDYKFSGCNIGGDGNPITPNAWYYNNDEATYGIDGVRKCGLLYNWYAVKLLNDNRNTLIPGWHVPTDDEWMEFVTAVGGAATAGTKLKANNISWAPNWGGIDKYGFRVLPAGRYDGSFLFIEIGAYFWSSTKIDESTAYSRNIDEGPAIGEGMTIMTQGRSIRLVKD